MTKQLSRVNLSIASQSEIERTARQLRAIRDGFLTTGLLPLLTTRPLILESWKRCRSLQVNAARQCAPLAIAWESELDILREANGQLVRAAGPVLAHLMDFLADSGYVVVLSDAQGRLLEVIGDAGVRRRLAHIDFVPGGIWSEAAAGTNAIGTALADGHVVQLMASEHYCEGWQDLTCTAAPIWHPVTGEVVGILDVTGNYRLIRPFLTGVLAAAALEIKQNLQSLLSAGPEGQKQSTLIFPPGSFLERMRRQRSDTTLPQTDALPEGRFSASTPDPGLLGASGSFCLLSPSTGNWAEPLNQFKGRVKALFTKKLSRGQQQETDVLEQQASKAAEWEPTQADHFEAAPQNIPEEDLSLGTNSEQHLPHILAPLSSCEANPGETPLKDDIPWQQSGEGAPGIPLIDTSLSRLYLQEHPMRDAERLVAAAGAISSSLDVSIALEKVAEEAAHLLWLESAAVCLLDKVGEIVSLHTWARQPAQAESLRGLKALLWQARAVSLLQERGEPVIIDDILTSTLLPAALNEEAGIRSLALLPLMTARGIIGFIAAPRPTAYHWVVDEVRLGQALAAQAATAIENARLFETLQQHNRHIEALNAIAQLLSTLPDPSQHLDLLLTRIAQLMDLDAGMVMLLDQNLTMTLLTQSGLTEDVLRDICESSLQPLHAVASQVAASKESLLICDAERTEPIASELLHLAGFCEMMAVPLAASSTILGVLFVGSYKPRGLTDEDLALFTTIGQQLGLTLKNAQLLRSTSEIEALREADRIKSRFIATVSHDLRSPLTAIRASVESLLDRRGVQSNQEQEQLLNNIAGQAGRLGRLVDQLLDLSRIEAGALPLDREWIELPVLIADALEKFEGLSNGYQSGYQIEQNLAEDLPLHYVDPDRFFQLLWNLLENACKYAPSGSPITVEAKWTGSEVVIGVADRGPGIPAAEREKIFQHFYRLDRDQRTHTQGSGLGLAICQGIAEAHGGRIWVEDRPGGGSIFKIALPLPAADPSQLEALDEHELCARDER